MDIAARIKELLPTGVTFRQMATELGVTRNIIAGQVYRMQEKGEIDKRHRPVARRAVVESPLDRQLQRNIRASVVKRRVQEETEEEDIDGVYLLDLNEGDCRWSLGETSRGHFFCAKPRRDPRTRYCAEHHSIVWVKSSVIAARRKKAEDDRS
jgi:hypothetical protein